MKKGVQIGKLNLGLVALLLLGIGYLGLMLFTGSTKPFMVVRGASMEPTFHSGDLLLRKSVVAGEVQVGDIIAFKVSPDERERLKMPANAVHRVVGIEGEGGELAFETKGDNSDVDPFKVSASAVHGVVLKNLGPLGRPFLFLSNPGVLLFLGLPILTFVVIVLASLWLTPTGREVKEGGVGEVVPGEIGKALGGLRGAIVEYGTHLRSHTAVVKHLAGTSEGLEQAVQQQRDSSGELKQAIHQQNEVLGDLTAVVRELKAQTTSDGKRMRTQSSPNGDRESASGMTESASPEISKTELKGEKETNGTNRKVQTANKGADETTRAKLLKATKKEPKAARGTSGTARKVKAAYNGANGTKKTKLLKATMKEPKGVKGTNQAARKVQIPRDGNKEATNQTVITVSVKVSQKGPKGTKSSSRATKVQTSSNGAGRTADKMVVTVSL